MRKRRGSGFFAGIFVGVLFSMTFFLVMYFLDIQILPASSLASDIRNRAEIVESYIDSYYWKDDVSDQTISEYAAKGMVAALGDKYSAYFTSEELKSSMEDVEGDYEGIGASVRYDEKTKNKTIQEVQKGRPAQKAGLKAGDILLSVNGEDVTKLSLNDTIQKIKGKEGKKSELVVLREENGEKTKKKITVTCEKIVNQTVTHRMLSGKTGYIAITSFTKETVKQYENALSDLEKKGQKGLIVDLRGNGGGSLTAVVDILDRMLPKGKLITEKNKVNGDKVYTSTDEKHFDKPVAVLINGGSASASEVFAGCMQDRKAASLVGVKSFGKGIVQTIFSLEKSCGGGIKLTTGEYLLPSGRCIQGKGLTSDVEAKNPSDLKQFGGKDDYQLQKAVEVINEKTAE